MKFTVPTYPTAVLPSRVEGGDGDVERGPGGGRRRCGDAEDRGRPGRHGEGTGVSRSKGSVPGVELVAGPGGVDLTTAEVDHAVGLSGLGAAGQGPGPPEVGVSGVIERVTVETLAVTGLPEASSTVTWGWVARVEPATELVGLAENTRWVGGGVT